MYSRLEKLADLKAKGVLTEAEFQAEKAKLLSGGGSLTSASSMPSPAQEQLAATTRAVGSSPIATAPAHSASEKKPLSITRAVLITLAILLPCVLIGLHDDKTARGLAALVSLGTAIWASVDASRLKRQVEDTAARSIHPVGVFFAMWLFWLVCFPWYLVVRSKIRAGRLEEVKRANRLLLLLVAILALICCAVAYILIGNQVQGIWNKAYMEQLPSCGSEEVLFTLKGLEVNILKENGNFNGFPLTPDRFIATDPVTLASDEKLRRRTCSVKMVYMISDRSKELLQSLASDNNNARLIPIARSYIASLNLNFNQIVALGNTNPVVARLALHPEELVESDPHAAEVAKMALGSAIASYSNEINKLGTAKDWKISLAPSKVQYTVRVNEDQNVKTSFVVDSELSKDAIRAVQALELLSIYSQKPSSSTTAAAPPNSPATAPASNGSGQPHPAAGVAKDDKPSDAEIACMEDNAENPGARDKCLTDLCNRQFAQSSKEWTACTEKIKTIGK
ncbi:MAG: SHOCT domain-containing protein [Terriglobales bacterium]